MTWGIKTHKIDRTMAMLAGRHKIYEGAFADLVEELHHNVTIKSPVGDRPKSGTQRFKDSWEVQHNSKYSAYIHNTAVHAYPVIRGSKKGSKPWPSAGPLTSEIGGRIWSNKMLDNPPNVGTYAQTVFDEDRVIARFKTLAKQRRSR